MIAPEPDTRLRRVLTFWPLVFYGLGVIVGAGIYVAIGTVVQHAGRAAPMSFLLAGITAALTGLCYAELAGRFPEAAGAAAYVKRGFASDRLAQLTGAAMTVAVAIGAAASVRGATQYLVVLLPWPNILLVALLVVIATAIAAFGVRESVGLAATIGLLEILGLLVAIAVGLLAAPAFRFDGMIPENLGAWSGVLAGAAIAFFAFIGFETLTNMAEEVKDPQRIVPRGIAGAIAASILLYVAVAMALVLSGRAAERPLLDLFSGRGALAFAVLAFISVANGILVETVMLARLFYGMARNGQLPAILGRVHPRTRTPLLATFTGGAIILAASLLVPFAQLLMLANGLTLLVFALVDLALWRVKRTMPAPPNAFVIPPWLPLLAAASALVLAGLGVRQ